VLDASRGVPVVSSLLNPDTKPAFINSIKEQYAVLRDRHLNKKVTKNLLPLAQARANSTRIDWDNYTPPTPKMLGVKVFKKYNLAEIAEYIDWTPFFQSWQLAGKYPAILTDEIVGEHATQLYNDAQKMLQQIITEKWLEARAVIGIFPANSIGDDVEVKKASFKQGNSLNEDTNDRHNEPTSSKLPDVVLHHLRQQLKKADGLPNRCLADFVAPKTSGKTDYIGAFAVTTGIGIEKHVKQFEDNNDDYSAILLKALADRLAEAFTELMHKRVRKEFWGYANAENLDNDSLITEQYQGIRPAPGYPACPDHTEKRTLWQLLDVEKNTNIQLTENCAMYPTAAVSGWYFSHPQSTYFGVGQITPEQVEDLAQRKSMTVQEMTRWLQPILG
jgi:5-methyltetrahydrofolate--homocysteine methyltransferase